jgi:hypothetical protein
MLEKTFRAAFVKALNKAALFAVPIESAVTPGIPDILVANHSVALVECKVVASVNSKRKFAMLFELNQLAFYHRWWKTGANNLWCAVYAKKTRTSYLLRLHPAQFGYTVAAIVEPSPHGSVTKIADMIRSNT